MNKIKKGKISLTISIGLTAFILIFVMVTQFKTVEETDLNMRMLLQKLKKQKIKLKNIQSRLIVITTF